MAEPRQVGIFGDNLIPLGTDEHGTPFEPISTVDPSEGSVVEADGDIELISEADIPEAADDGVPGDEDNGEDDGDEPQDDESDSKTAAEVIEEIKAAESAEEVDELADGDERVTVQNAADKRKEELAAGDNEDA